ncbi:hypothetical protein AAFC00_003003 [Neodothiora populina]|uniref:Tcp11-domain-containing protein n=1 Tax=Neodothiora populina TaxID=2781224 RepID=A0ABR3P993_9PEZI
MSFTTDAPAWTRQGNDDCNAAPATPRDNQRLSRANNSRSSYQSHGVGHEGSMPAQHDQEHVQADVNNSADSISSIPNTKQEKVSDREIMYSLYRLLEQLPAPEDVDLVDLYQRAAPLPPITQDSLAELEVTRIVSNPKLRHDVNFDRELHFRPNLDGSRGKHKIKTADEYWKALMAELELYRAIGGLLLTCQDEEQYQQLSRMMKASQIRIPGIFEAIKEILMTLVPARDQSVVEERLDIPMIMQQISNGVFNLMDLALWLATLLKAHCAPMRDDWVDQMVTQIRRGVEEGDQKRIALGLRQTLGVLEAMKLDVANHQIRNLRAMLIEDTVNFQQRYHLTRLHQGRLDVRRARMWYKREASHLIACDPTVTPVEIFSSALLRSISSQSSMSSLPETFQLDAERIRTLRTDINSLIQLDICCDLFDLLVRNKVNVEVGQAAKNTIRASISDIVGESRLFSENAGNIAAEIVRSALILEGAAICYNSELADFVEKQLQVDLQPSSVAFATRVQNLVDKSLPVLHASIASNMRHTILELHEAMLPSSQPTVAAFTSITVSAQSQPRKQALQDIIRRITHLAVIHWHIWSPMVYNIRDESQLSSTNSAASGHVGPAVGDGNVISSAGTIFTSSTQPQSTGFASQPSDHSEPSMLDGRPPQ